MALVPPTCGLTLQSPLPGELLSILGNGSWLPLGRVTKSSVFYDLTSEATHIDRCFHDPVRSLHVRPDWVWEDRAQDGAEGGEPPLGPPADLPSVEAPQILLGFSETLYLITTVSLLFTSDDKYISISLQQISLRKQ